MSDATVPPRAFTKARYWPLLRWLFIAQAVFNVVTNAYFLRFLEPTISRKALALISVGAAAGALLVERYGLPSLPSIGSFFKRHAVLWVLLVILAVAFGLRLWGITYGLPQSYNSDEYDFVHSYLKMIKRGDFNPRWWIHPSLQAYVNVATYLVVFLAEVPSGRWRSVQELLEEDFLYWGRFGTGVIPGTLTVLVTFLLGRRMFGKGVGLAAASLMAVSPAAIQWSQYNKPDPLLILMAPLSLLLILVYFERGGIWMSLVCGLAFGLTAAAKYNGGFVVLSFVLAVALRHRSRLFKVPDLYVAAGGTVSGFFIGCPYWLEDFPRFVDHIANSLWNYGYAGWPGAMGENNWYFHARYAVGFGLGTLGFIAVLIGLAIAIYRLDAKIGVFLSFPVLYYAYYSAQLINIPGNMLCTYPELAVLAGLGIGEVASVFSRRVRTPVLASWSQPASFGALLLLCLWAPLAEAVSFNEQQTLPDTGNLARAWIEGRIPPGTGIATERESVAVDRRRYDVVQEARIINRGIASYRESGVEYLVVSSALYERFGPEHRQTRAYQRIFARCPLVKEFSPEEGRIIGPTIRILQVPESDENASE